MSRITAVDPTTANGATKTLLDGVQHAMGIVPNLMRTVAHSPAALEGYLNFSGALSKGVLNPKLRQQIAIAIAQQDGCDYCLSAHTLLGGKAHLSSDELVAARHAESSDAKARAALKFAVAVLEKRGILSDSDVAEVEAAGFTEAEIVEIVAHVGLNIFTNYFNNVAQTEIDFPLVSTKS